MDIFSAPAYRISPLARQAFGEKQRPGQPPASPAAPEGRHQRAAESRDPPPYRSGPPPQERPNRPPGTDRAIAGTASASIPKGSAPGEKLQRATLPPANRPVTERAATAQQTVQMAAITRIEIARLEARQETRPTPPLNIAGAARYQQVAQQGERPRTKRLNSYA